MFKAVKVILRVSLGVLVAICGVFEGADLITGGKIVDWLYDKVDKIDEIEEDTEDDEEDEE